MFDIVETTLSADVAASGTFTVSYPDGRSAGSYGGTYAHKMGALQSIYESPTDFTVSFDATVITVTWGSSETTLPAGTDVVLQFDRLGVDNNEPDRAVLPSDKIQRAGYAIIDLGSPITADTDNMVKAATSTELPNAETVTYTPDTAGTTPTDGVGPVVVVGGVNYWEMDVPRNVSVAVTHASSIVAMTVTVTGLDEYGETVVEDIAITATGTSKTGAGKKAFKHVRSIAFTSASNAEANTANAGFADVLGLPVFLSDATHIVADMEDNVIDLSIDGTAVAGVSSVATATTGDVRGTYDPGAAADGAVGFKVIALLPDPTQLGVAQYGG